MPTVQATRSPQSRRKLKGMVIIDATEPDVELAIGEHMFKGIAFAVDYAGIPLHLRDGLQDQHVALMRSMQDLVRERAASRLQ